MSDNHLKLSYIYGGIVQYRAGQSLPPRTLNDYELVLVLEGNIRYVLNGESHLAKRGSLLLARPGFHEHYTWDTKTTTRHAYLHFDMERIPADWPEPSSWPIIDQKPDPLVPHLFRHLNERVSAHPQWPNTAPDLDTTRLIESLITLHLRPPSSPSLPSETFPPAVYRALNRMRELLETDPKYLLSLEELSRSAHVSDKHLCRLFQEHIGQPPLKTFRLMKLQKAMSLLGRSSLSIQEIANRCGFENPLYFSRCFRQTYNIPPSEARSLYLKKTPLPANPLPTDIIPRIHW